MGKAFVLARKDLLLLWRDKFGLFWVLAFPLIYALFFGSLFGNSNSGGGSAPMRVLVATPADGPPTFEPAVESMLERLDASDAIALERAPLADAENRVRRGNAVAYLKFTPKTAAAGDGDEAAGFDFLWGDFPTMHVGIDPSRQAEKGYLQGLIMEAAFAGLEELFTDPTAMSARLDDAREAVAGDDGLTGLQKTILTTFFGALDAFMSQLSTQFPANEDGTVTSQATGGFGDGPSIEFESVVRRQEGPRSAFEITFPSAILWGVMGCAAAFAITLVRERQAGTLLRLFGAPLSRAEILLGKAIACFLSCTIVIVLLLAFAWTTLGLRIDDPLMLAFGILSTSACFVGIMMLLSVIGKTEQAVAGAGWGVMVMLAMLGGGMVPLIAMPKWLYDLGSISPVKWGILGLEGAIWRGYSFAEMLVPCGILLGVGAGCFVLGWQILARRAA